MSKVLVVEDDKNLVSLLKDQLESHNYVVEVAEDGEYALALMRTYQYDLVVLDWQLPGMEGIELCRAYRLNGGKGRVLMLTGKNTIDDKEVGFDAGADDYLTKPFHVRELLARLRALMRRKPEVSTDEVVVGSLTIAPRTFKVTVNGEEVRLTPREFALLEFLARHPGEVFDPDSLLDSIWPSDTEASKANIKTYVHRIREKLAGQQGAPSIVTVHGAGYRLELP